MLIEITQLLNKAQRPLTIVTDSQPISTPGKPPQPFYTQKVETEIGKAWNKVKLAGDFTASTAKGIVTGDKEPRHRGTDSFNSSILCRWAREGSIERVQEGSGTRAAIYKISN